MMSSKRQRELNEKFKKLREEYESINSKVQSIVEKGQLCYNKQSSITDSVVYLQSYPRSCQELDKLINLLVELNCHVETISVNGDSNPFTETQPDLCLNVQASVTVVEQSNFVANCELKKENSDVTNLSNLSEFASNTNLVEEIHSILESTESQEVDREESCIIGKPLTEKEERRSPSAEIKQCTSFSQLIPLSTVEVGDILEMKFSSGNHPWNFWLHSYCDKELKGLFDEMKTMLESECLSKFSGLPTVNDQVCGYNGKQLFRGQVLSLNSSNEDESVTLVDVDSGEICNLSSSNIWHLGKDLQKLPLQGIYCRLKGSLGEPDLWFGELASMFQKALCDRMLVVTICDKLYTTMGYQFIVEIDSHCDSTSTKIDVNEWVTKFVVPKLEALKRGYGIPETFSSILNSLDPFLLYNANSENEDIDLYQLEKFTLSSPTGNKSMKSDCSNDSKNPNSPKVTKSEPQSSLIASSIDELNQLLETHNELQSPPVNKSASSSDSLINSNDNSFSKVKLHFNTKFSHAVGLEFSVMLSYVESPGEFYVHIVCEDNTNIDLIEEGMTSYYSTKKVELHSKDHAKLYLGKYCAALCLDDNKWYRAEILDWNNGKEEVTVHFVDYGNQALVKLEQIQPLVKCFAEHPIFAQKCHLAFVCPPNNVDIWPENSVGEFRKLLNFEKLYQILVMKPLTTDGGSMSVLLIDSICLGQQSINDHMIDTGLACEMLDVSRDWDPMREDFDGPRNYYEYDDEEACTAVMGYLPKDEARVCQFFSKTGKCYKGGNCRKEHIITHPDGWTSDREAVFQDAFSKLVLPSEGRTVQIQITEIININSVYAQICSSVSNIVNCTGYTGMEDEETLITLNNFLNTPQNVKKLRRLTVMPAFGQIVVAQFPQDKRWYRARVLDSVPETGTVEVFFVDYGNREIINEKFIRDIDPQYLHLPFQAVECIISNVEMIHTATEEENLKSINYFKTVALYRIMQVTILRRNESLCQMEVLMFSKEGINIGESIIKNGYGVEKQYTLICDNNAKFLPG